MLYQFFAALFYAASFKPIGLWIAAPIALAIQIYALRKSAKPELQSFIFAFLSSLIILSWSRVFVGVLPWILLALLQGLLAIPLGIAARFTKNIPILIFVMLALEELRARFPFGGFSWTKIAFSQVDSPFAPIVSISGMAGLSLITLLVSYLFLTKSLRALTVLIALFTSTFFIELPQSALPPVQVLAVQGGVPQRGLEFNARAEAVLDNHITETRNSFSQKDQIIIWPENAIDIDPIANRKVAEKITSLTKDLNRPLIAGAIIDNPTLVNATVLFNEQGNPESVYVKRYLTPFGEYIPLRSIAKIVSPHVSRVRDFSPGAQLIQHQLATATVGSIICYELLNDGLVREAARGASFISVHTNSATFSGSNEGEQQLAITRLRAIETGRSIVSISTTGPSAIIDHRGEVLHKLNDGEVGSLSAAIVIQKSTTLANQIGGYSTLAVLLFSLSWAMLSTKTIAFGRRRELR